MRAHTWVHLRTHIFFLTESDALPQTILPITEMLREGTKMHPKMHPREESCLALFLLKT